MEVWEDGFKTKTACYEWAASSKYFNPAYFKARESGFKKRKPDRTMYAGFLEWAGSLPQQNPTSRSDEYPNAREDAIDFFNKRMELEERRGEQARRELLKTFFSSSHVREWTGLGDYWPGVKEIMDAVREKFGGEVHLARFLADGGAEKLRSIVLEIQDDLGIFPPPTNEAVDVGRKDGKKVDGRKDGVKLT